MKWTIEYRYKDVAQFVLELPAGLIAPGESPFQIGPLSRRGAITKSRQRQRHHLSALR